MSVATPAAMDSGRDVRVVAVSVMPASYMKYGKLVSRKTPASVGTDRGREQLG